MTTQTLYNLVDSIQVSRIRLARFQLSQQDNSPWTAEEEKLLFKVYFSFMQLMIEYGPDLSLIQNFFPSRSRKQLKRKHRDLSTLKSKTIKRIEERKVR